MIGSDVGIAGSLLSLSWASTSNGSGSEHSDKVTTRTITNYVNNKSNKRQFTPYKPQANKKKRMFFRVYC